MASVGRNVIKAPFQWFGGKSREAATVWRGLGADVPNYVEPYGGSLAVLLARPGGAGKLETVNDRDCMVSNVWRALQHDPYQVAAHCDWPVSEPDLHARHLWLVQHLTQGAAFREAMLTDPDFYDAQVAGWWLWGIAQWIGSGWCREPTDAALPARKKPDLYGRGAGRGIRAALPERDSVTARNLPNLRGERGTLARQRTQLSGNKGVQAPRKRPDLHGMGVNTRMLNLGNTRRGVHRDHLPAGHSEIANALLAELDEGRAPPCFEWFVALLDRLRRVRVVCGDWQRVLTPSVLGTTTTRNSGMNPCAVFLDAPYQHEFRDPRLYSLDDPELSSLTFRWALEHGDDPDLRIAVCGLEGEHVFPDTWTKHEWTGVRGYGSGKNRHLERIWFSPHCLPLTETKDPQLPLSLP